MALPIRFWKTWVSSSGLDVTVGKGSCVITAADSWMLTVRLFSTLSKTAATSVRSVISPRPARE